MTKVIIQWLKISAAIIVSVTIVSLQQLGGLKSTLDSYSFQAKTETSNPTAVKQASDAVVQVNVYKQVSSYSFRYGHSRFAMGSSLQQIGSGSAFFVTVDGYLITNRHVVSDENLVYRILISPGDERDVQVVYRDTNQDLAVLKANGQNFPTIPLADSNAQIGESVVSIGNALGQVLDSVSTGQVNGLNRSILVENDSGTDVRLAGMIQTNNQLYPGDSGGPLLNAAGQAIGVDAASSVSGQVSFAVPIQDAKLALKSAGVSI